jgi:hypothetical protein
MKIPIMRSFHRPYTSSALYMDILLSILLSNTFNLISLRTYLTIQHNIRHTHLTSVTLCSFRISLKMDKIFNHNIQNGDKIFS